MADVSGLLGVPVAITEKLDGGNICLCRDAVYARSHSGPVNHPAFDWLKRKHAEVRLRIPDAVSVFGEYLYAVHTIEYEMLPSYLMIIAIRDDHTDRWFSWEETQRWASDLGFPTVPVLDIRRFDSASELQSVTTQLAAAGGLFGEREGLVVRRAEAFSTADFPRYVGKWVRVDHVQGEHWMLGPIRKQKLQRRL